MGITAKNQRPGRTEDKPKVGEKFIPEEQHGVRTPGRQAAAEGGIVEPAEMMGARVPGDIGHELVRIAREQVHIPFERGAKAGVVPRRYAEIPEIKHAQRQATLGRQPAEPRAVILRRVGKDDGQTRRRRSAHESVLRPERETSVRSTKGRQAPMTTMTA